MKQLLFLALVVLPMFTHAQLTISTHLTSPAPNLQFYIQNDSEDMLRATDTLVFTVPGFGATAYTGYYLEPYDTMQFSYDDMPISSPYCITVDVKGVDTTDNTSCITTHIEPIDRMLQVYPNPCHDYIWIGKEQYDMGGYVPGVYYIKGVKVVKL